MAAAQVADYAGVCFVVSPFGASAEEGTAYATVLAELIVPAVESAGLGLKVVRGDEFTISGSFLKDVLEYLAGAWLVIADLSGRNPNVFYELGVRHALSPRTILIADRADEIPSDLREYRALVYGPPTPPDAFRNRLRTAVQEIAANPERPDNPVWGHLRIPSLPDDLRQTFGARRIGVGETQARLLLYIERAAAQARAAGTTAPIPEDKMRKQFQMSGTELYYRLEQLRLLGFLVKSRDAADVQFAYDLSPAYWRELDS